MVELVELLSGTDCHLNWICILVDGVSAFLLLEHAFVVEHSVEVVLWGEFHHLEIGGHLVEHVPVELRPAELSELRRELILEMLVLVGL